MPVKSKEPNGPCEVSLDIEVESAKVGEAVDKAYREFSKYIAVPGFRKGKAPMAFVRQRVPQEQLRERTAEILVGPAYEQAIKENEINAYARPRVELVKMETTAPDYEFEFKAIVPLPPTVILGPYVGLKLDRDRLEVSEADVDKRIAALQERATDYPDIEDRAAQSGDVVVGDLSVSFEDGEDGENGEFKPVAITIGDEGNVPGVDEALVGVKKGEEKEFDLVYPDDFANAEIAGKHSHCIVRVKELYGRVVPAVDDEFASKNGADTVDGLRSKLRGELEIREVGIADRALENKLIETIVSASKVEYPTILLDVEMEDDIRSFREDLEKRETSLGDYLQSNNLTETQLADSFKDRAEIRLRRGLVLGEIARVEKLEVTDADVDQEIRRRADLQHTNVQAMRAYLDRSEGMGAVRESAYLRKILGFLIAASEITDKVVSAADDTPKAAAAPKPKRARKKKDAADEPAAAE